MPQLLTYAKFYNEEQAAELTGFLDRHQIAYLLEKDREVLDKIYVGETLDMLLNLKIRSEDFTKVNDLVVNEFPVDITQVRADYYLFSFTKEELIQVIQGEGWNYFDRALAKKILSDKDVNIVSADHTHIEPPFKPYRLNSTILLAQYVCSILISYVGILIGLATWAAYKTTSNGKRVQMYDAASRKHAAAMFVISVAKIVLYMVWPHRLSEALFN